MTRRKNEHGTRELQAIARRCAGAPGGGGDAVGLPFYGVDAWATSDTTFAAPLTTVTNMVGGTGGQLAAMLTVGAALVGSVLRFNAI